jgi:hypothetical protein
MWAPAATTGTLSISGEWGGTASTPVSVPAGDSSFTLSTTATAEQIKLWWPAGLGAQPLYNLTTTFTPSSSDADGSVGSYAVVGAAVSTTRRVGFRYFVLVTGNDLDADWMKKNADGDGSASNGMFWRINGATVLSRGANMIPMEELGELYPLPTVNAPTTTTTTTTTTTHTNTPPPPPPPPRTQTTTASPHAPAKITRSPAFIRLTNK